MPMAPDADGAILLLRAIRVRLSFQFRCCFHYAFRRYVIFIISPPLLPCCCYDAAATRAAADAYAVIADIC